MTWLNLTMANQTVKNGLKAKKITLPQFLILQNFKKILRADPELWWCVIFRSRMAHLSWTSFFLSTSHCYYSHLPIGPFHCAKFFLWIQSYVDAQFLSPKWPISTNENFFRKPVNEPCFFHSCLSTCQKWKPDINL